MEPELTHINEEGRARMVDVTPKDVTHRIARAAGKVCMNQQTLALIKSGGIKKGDVLAVAQVAGIMAAKRTWETIPMCHQIPLTGVDVHFAYGKIEMVDRRLPCALLRADAAGKNAPFNLLQSLAHASPLTKCPLFPPSFSRRRMSVIVMSRCTAFAIS